MKTLLSHTSDVPENSSKVVKGPNGDEIVLFKVNGCIYALDNRCPHMEGPLGEGGVENGVVTCPWHGWQFQVQDGACLNMPGVDALSLPISVEEEQIYLLD